jgi:broad specificity phosphatase PhoE
MAITFNFVRHAQSELNLHGNLIGGSSVEIPLTEKGESQATVLGEYFAKNGVHFDEAYCSTAVRTQQTAKFCFKAMSCQMLWHCHEELSEQSLGDWEKKLRSLIYERSEVKLNYKYNNWKFIPGDEIKGESQKQVGQRMANWIKQIVLSSDNMDIEKNIVVFSHGSAIKNMLATLFKSDPNWKRYVPEFKEGEHIEEKNPKFNNASKQSIENASITQVQYADGNFFLLNINEFPHLKLT